MSMYGEELYGSGTWGGSGSSVIEGEDPTWTIIGGAITDTIAYGPSYFTDPDTGLPIAAPGVFVAPMALEMVAVPATGTVLATFADSFSRSFQDEANNTGTASFAVVNTDPEFDQLELGRMVTFKVYGNRAISMIIESMHKVSAAEGEEFDQITVVTGRGHMALWEDFVLYPSRGPESVPIEEDRVFNWTSPTYVDTGWKYAKPITKQAAYSPGWTFMGVKAPVEWPDPGAYWIWAPGTTSSWARPGVCYFRKTFTVPSGCTQIAIYYSIDNRGKIYVDGIPFAEQEGGIDWLKTKFVVVDVTPGPHLLAIEALNEVHPRESSQPDPPSPQTHVVVPGDTLWSIALRYYGSGAKWRTIFDRNAAQIQADATAQGLWDPYDPGHWIFPGQVFIIPGIVRPASNYVNPGGVLVAIYVQDEVPSDLIVHTNHAWRVVAYPDEPPGMSVGEVIRHVKREASRRGNDLVDNLTLKFTDKVDSAGRPWPIVADIASKVGTDYLTFLLELTAKYADIWMAPGTLDLYAWIKGERAKVRAVTLHAPTDPDDPLSGNLYELSHTVLT